MAARATRWVLAAVASLALVSACSSDKAGTETTTTPSPTPVTHGAFGECLRSHGVPDPPHSPVGPPAGVDQNTWDNAMQACGSLAPAPPGPAG
jgi:hypothetical protein